MKSTLIVGNKTEKLIGMSEYKQNRCVDVCMGRELSLRCGTSRLHGNWPALKSLGKFLRKYHYGDI